MSAPWFKMYPADYLLDAKVASLSLESQAILVRLWCVCARDIYFPDSPDAVAKIIGVEARVLRKNWQRLRTFFDAHIGGLYSRRMEKERKEYDEKCAKLRANASHGGKAKAKHLLEQKSSRCSTKIGLLKPAEGETETEVPPYPPSGGERDGLVALKAVWPKARVNGADLEHYREALEAGATDHGLITAAEAFLSDPAACSAPRFAPSLGVWLSERRWEPYLSTPEPEGSFTVGPDPLAVS